MYYEIRLEKIRHILNEYKQIDVKSLCKIMNVSISTIRRDLIKLEHEGFLIRNHGGVSLKINDYNKTTVNAYDPQLTQKSMIGLSALSLVDDNDVIFIGAGNTCFEFAKQLKHKQNLTVVTNSLVVAYDLCRKKNINLISIGGDVAIEDNKPFTTGQLASISLENIFIQKSFITVNGITIDSGYTINNQHLTYLYTELLNFSEKMIVLADNSKFGVRALKKLCDFKQIPTLVTNKPISASYENFFTTKENNIYNI